MDKNRIFRNSTFEYIKEKNNIVFSVQTKGIHLDGDTLLEELLSDIKVFTNIDDPVPINVFSRYDTFQSNSSSNDHLLFLFYHLFIHEYCLKSLSLHKINPIEFIEEYYLLNRYESNQINKFNNEYNSRENVLA